MKFIYFVLFTLYLLLLVECYDHADHSEDSCLNLQFVVAAPPSCQLKKFSGLHSFVEKRLAE